MLKNTASTRQALLDEHFYTSRESRGDDDYIWTAIIHKVNALMAQEIHEPELVQEPDTIPLPEQGQAIILITNQPAGCKQWQVINEFHGTLPESTFAWTDSGTFFKDPATAEWHVRRMVTKRRWQAVQMPAADRYVIKYYEDGTRVITVRQYSCYTREDLAREWTHENVIAWRYDLEKVP